MSITFEGQFDSFDQVSNVNDYISGFDIDKIFTYTNARHHSNSYIPEAIDDEYNHIRDISSLLITLLCEFADKTVRVVDVGGGFGITFIELLKRSQRKNFKYTVYELEDIVGYYQENPFIDDDRFLITGDFSQVREACDVVIFGSSIQYFSDYPLSIERILKKFNMPKFVLVTHTILTLNEDFVTLQINMGQSRIPLWIFNFDSFLDNFSKLGYDHIFTSSVNRKGMFDNFPKNYHDYRVSNILFVKRFDHN